MSSTAWPCHEGPRFFPTLYSAIFNSGFMSKTGARWQQQVQGHTHTYCVGRKVGGLNNGKPSCGSSHFSCLISQNWVIDSFLSNSWKGMEKHLASQGLPYPPSPYPGSWLHGGGRDYGRKQMVVDNPTTSTIKLCNILSKW